MRLFSYYRWPDTLNNQQLADMITENQKRNMWEFEMMKQEAEKRHMTLSDYLYSLRQEKVMNAQLAYEQTGDKSGAGKWITVYVVLACIAGLLVCANLGIM